MDTTKIIFDCPLSPWLVGVAALIVLGVVVVFARRDTATLGAVVRSAILLLVFVSTVMLTGILLSPKLIRTWPDPHKPLCNVLVDGSRSMLLADTYSGEIAKWIDLHLPPPGGSSGPRKIARKELAQLLLQPREEGWLAKLQNRFELAGWRFADGLAAMPLDGKTPFEVDDEGYTTALGEALDQAGRGTGEQRPRVVVVLSDGAWNTGRDPSEIARVLGRLGVPVFVIGFGNPSPPRDASVVELQAPKSVLLGDEVQLVAEIATTGMGAVRLPVQLISGSQTLDEKRVVTLPSGRHVNVTFSFVPDTPGRRTFTVRVPKQEGEQDIANNVAKATLEVTERKIRVLLIDNEPRWEFRFIRNVFERDPAVEPTVTLLRPKIGPIKGEGYLERLPMQKKDFASFDLIILGDVPRTSLPDEFLKEAAEFVKTRGGALVVIAGRRRHLRGLVGTPLADILPVKLEGEGAEGRSGPFSVELTQDGASHLVTRLAADPEENETLWSRLPKQQWSFGVSGLARGATSLIVHPYRLAASAKLPLLAVQRVGTGKVMYLGLEGTWRWRREVGDTYHYRFWAQAVRWMVKKQFAKGDPRARLSLDRTECDVGEAVEVEAYCLGPDGFPLEKARVWVRIDSEGDSQRLALAAAPGGWGIYRASFKPKEPGKYVMRPIVSAYGDQPLESEVILTATRPDLERKFLAQDANALSAIALASGGRYLGIHEVETLPSLLAAKVERRVLTAEYSPCRHWLYYTALALLLGTAWLIRKRSGLA